MPFRSMKAMMQRLFILQNRMVYTERRVRFLFAVVVVSFGFVMMAIVSFLIHRIHLE